MGFYIQTAKNRDKAQQIIEAHGAVEVTPEEARIAMDDNSKGVIVVLSNPSFDAAGFAFDLDEFEAFTRPDDRRLKKFLVMDRLAAKSLSGYRGE
jgi:hypothetical protein